MLKNHFCCLESGPIWPHELCASSVELSCSYIHSMAVIIILLPILLLQIMRDWEVEWLIQRPQAEPVQSQGLSFALCANLPTCNIGIMAALFTGQGGLDEIMNVTLLKKKRKANQNRRYWDLLEQNSKMEDLGV